MSARPPLFTDKFYYLYLTPRGAIWMNAAWPQTWLPREWKRVMNPHDDSKPFMVNAWWSKRHDKIESGFGQAVATQ